MCLKSSRPRTRVSLDSDQHVKANEIIFPSNSIYQNFWAETIFLITKSPKKGNGYKNKINYLINKMLAKLSHK